MKHGFLVLGLLLFSLDLFGQFQTCNSSTNKNLYDVWLIDQNIGIAVGDSGTIVRSSDSGLNWNLIMSNDTINFEKVKFFDELNGIAVGSDIYITDNAGLTWSAIPHSNSHFYDIEILNQTTCLLSGYPTALIKSVDVGLSFSDLVAAQNNDLGLLSFLDENIGFACNDGAGGLSPTIKTIDGGTTWTTLPSNINVNTVMKAMSFTSESVGFKGGWYSPHLQKTTDSANNWEDVVFDDSMLYASIYDFHIESNQPNSYYASGWYGQVFKSTDGGGNWFELNSGIANTISLHGIFFINDTFGIAVGQYGTIIRTTNGGVTAGLPDDDKILNLTIFPNPTRDVLYLEETNDINILRFEIYDISGRKLISEVYSSENIDISMLPKGMHILKLITDKGNLVQKILKE